MDKKTPLDNTHLYKINAINGALAIFFPNISFTLRIHGEN